MSKKIKNRSGFISNVLKAPSGQVGPLICSKTGVIRLKESKVYVKRSKSG